MRRNNKGHHLCAVRLDLVSVDSKKSEMMPELVFPCFAACWHMLSFIASESTLAAIPWDFTASQWLNPHCTLAALGISHGYFGLAWAMLNVAKEMSLCCWGHSSHHSRTQGPCQAELDAPAWPSERSTLMDQAEETEEKKTRSYKALLKAQNTSFDSWAPFTKPGPSCALSNEIQHRVKLL